MTSVKPISNSSIKPNSFSTSNYLKIVPKEKIDYSLDTIDGIKKVNEKRKAHQVQIMQERNQVQLRNKLIEIFALDEKAKQMQKRKLFSGFNFSLTDDAQTVKNKFKESDVYHKISRLKKKEKIKPLLEQSISFSTLEKKLFSLRLQGTLNNDTILKTVLEKHYGKIDKINKGYHSLLSCAQDNAIKAIDLLVNNPFYEISTTKEAIEYTYLAIASGSNIPSPIWQETALLSNHVANEFAQIYLAQINKNNNQNNKEVKKQAREKAENAYGVFIPPKNL
ncbi:hypothetical protein K9M74_04215 [Candidatus Woesearchaeota archaeon]|nr:hypothetical protein [Candidatus Woesearchaeota archaeon]